MRGSEHSVNLTRRTLMAVSTLCLARTALGQGQVEPPKDRVSNGRPRPEIPAGKPSNKGSALDKDLVFEFVHFAHTNLEVVKDMLVDTPALVNAAWDWGGGDWETALGAAGHMGRRDIAEHLISAGARLELPAACMLGELEFVKAALTAFPVAARTAGPHGIPLIAHAKRGGAEAAAVVEYLEGLSLAPKDGTP